MSSTPVVPDEVSEDDRGELGLEVMQDKEWLDVSVVVPPDPDPEPEPEPESELCDEEDTKMSEQEYETGKESESIPDGFEVSYLIFCIFFSLSFSFSKVLCIKVNMEGL